MRDVNRLYKLYAELTALHLQEALDVRFGQLFYNFMRWLDCEHRKDIFYIEDDELIKYMKEYLHVEE